MRSQGIAPPPAEAGMPPAEVRGILGLLIFIHLFAVVVALTSYAFPSQLQNRLSEVLGPYSATLGFDLSANSYPTGRFYLTHAETGDVDFLIEIDATLPDGSDETLTIPMPGLAPGERRRFQALANAAGAMAANEDIEPLVLRSLAGSVLKQWGASRGLVKLKAHTLMSIEAFSAADPKARDPFDARYYTTTYQAYVLVSPTGEVDLVKRSAAGEVAPVEKGSSGK